MRHINDTITEARFGRVGRESFKIHWDDNTEEFVVELLYNGKVTEENRFKWCEDAWKHIGEQLGDMQIAGEDWEITYTI